MFAWVRSKPVLLWTVFSSHLLFIVIINFPDTELTYGIFDNTRWIFLFPTTSGRLLVFDIRGRIHCTAQYKRFSAMFKVFLFLFFGVRCEEKSDRGSRQGAFETLCLNSGLFYPLFQSFVESHSNEHWGHKNRYSENRGGFACLINLAHIPLSETR